MVAGDGDSGDPIVPLTEYDGKTRAGIIARFSVLGADGSVNCH